MTEEIKQKQVLIFERHIGAENIRKLEEAGYVVVCTSVKYTIPGATTPAWFHKVAWDYLSHVPDSWSSKTGLGMALINHLVKISAAPSK